MPDATSEHPFSLTHGGPFYHLLRRAHLIGRTGRMYSAPLVLVLWLPIGIAALVEVLFGEALDPFASDPSVHLRLLAGLPLLFAAERMLHWRCALVGEVLRNTGIAERATVNSIFERAEHWRDSRNVEALLALVVILATQATLWGVARPPTLHTTQATTFSFVTFWYLGIALPVFQFVLMRWLWRWIVWIYVLARVARSQLLLDGLHPDRACGLKFLLAPIDAFAIYVSAIATIAAASWLVPLLRGVATLQSFVPTFIIFVISAIVVAWGPLLLFSRQIYSARERTYAAYTTFAHEYVGEFRTRWLSQPTHGSDKLGTPDLQSLADLGNSFAAPDETRILPLSGRVLATLVVAALVPMLPLIMVVIPFSQLVAHLGEALLGPFAS